MRARQRLPLALAVQATACVPVCGPVPRLPGIEGVVTRKGAPLPDVQVAVIDDLRHESCAEAKTWVATDANGRFHLDPDMKHLEIVLLVPGDALKRWRVCLRPRDGDAVSWTISSAGPNHAPRKVELSCDLANDARKLCQENKRTW